jgi:hypothetical protein
MHQEQSRSRSDRFKSIFKNSILTLSVLVIAISTISGSINANARQQEILNQELFNNPQAILNVTFKDNVYLDNIIDNELNSDKNWQGLKFDNSTFGITSLSGLSNIGGVEEMVSINGQYSTRSIKKSYKDKLQELIIKIDDLKNNKSFLGEAGANATEGVNAAITTELAKMNNWEVKKQRYINWSQSKILSISLIGNTNTLDIIKEILVKSGHVKTIEILIVENLKKEADLLREKLKGQSEQEQQLTIKNIIQTEFKESGGKGNFEQSIRAEFESSPEYIKNPIQDTLNQVETKSIETVTSRMINGLMYGTIAKAALPVWMTSITAMAITISHYSSIGFFWVVRFCSSNYWRCAMIIWGIIDGANTADDIRRKLFN